MSIISAVMSSCSLPGLPRAMFSDRPLALIASYCACTSAISRMSSSLVISAYFFIELFLSEPAAFRRRICWLRF